MGIANIYWNWKIVHLLNRIPSLIAKGRFEHADKRLQEAGAIFEILPADMKKKNSQAEDLIINMRTLLGREFRKKLELELDKNDFSQIASRKSGKNNFLGSLRQKLECKKQHSMQAHKKFGVKKQKKSSLKYVKPELKNKSVKKDAALGIAKSKLQEWKRKGYDTSLLEKQFYSHSGAQASQMVVEAKKPFEISKKDEKVFELQSKISDWKKQGYDTVMLEKQLSILVKK